MNNFKKTYCKSCGFNACKEGIISPKDKFSLCDPRNPKYYFNKNLNVGSVKNGI